MCGNPSEDCTTLIVNRVEKKFYSFWLKDVESVDLTKHCIKCLRGHRYKEMSQEDGFRIELPKDKVYYLCGVTYPYNWEKNFHLAFQYDKNGDTFTFEQNGVSVTVKRAKRIIFSEEDVDITLPQVDDPKFRRCRNWQFANYFEHNLKEMVYNRNMNNQQTTLWHEHCPNERG